ncbi:uncharacterized protein [Watersipora subatra]|uniref:uncharacterized protein n=1 Tax=Watersipora subatra TaxID=2589382 RepID=UPI00355BDA7E
MRFNIAVYAVSPLLLILYMMMLQVIAAVVFTLVLSLLTWVILPITLLYVIPWYIEELMSGAVSQLRKDVKKNSEKAKFRKSLRLNIPDSKLEVIKEEEPHDHEIACISPVWNELQANRPSLRKEKDSRRTKTKSTMNMTAIEMYNHGAEPANTLARDMNADEVGDGGKNRNNANELEMEPKGCADAIGMCEKKVDSELATVEDLLPLPTDDAVRIPKKRNARQTLLSCFGCFS